MHKVIFKDIANYFVILFFKKKKANPEAEFLKFYFIQLSLQLCH